MLNGSPSLSRDGVEALRNFIDRGCVNADRRRRLLLLTDATVVRSRGILEAWPNVPTVARDYRAQIDLGSKESRRLSCTSPPWGTTICWSAADNRLFAPLEKRVCMD